MEESNQRIEKLREQLKAANQKILFYQNEAQTAKSTNGESQSLAVSQLKQALEQTEQTGDFDALFIYCSSLTNRFCYSFPTRRGSHPNRPAPEQNQPTRSGLSRKGARAQRG